MLVTRLEECALAETTDKDYEKKQMTQVQVAAARILLLKTLPDRKATETTIKDERFPTKEELFARLKAIGCNPEEVWKE